MITESVYLTDKEVYDLVLELLSSERIEEFRCGDQNYMVVFTVPTSSDRVYADFVEKITLNKAIEEGCFSEDNIPEEFVRTFFTLEDEEDLKELELKLKGYRTLLKKRIKGTDSYKKDLEKLKEIEEKRNKLLSKKSEATQFSAEYYAREEKIFTLLYLNTLNLEDRTKFWFSKRDIEEDTTPEEIYPILNKFLGFYWGPDTSILRFIARSGQWRNIYLSSIKTNCNIFGKPMKDLSISQLQLLNWSMFYQNIQELPSEDKPPYYIIEDDKKLDKYMDGLYKKYEADSESNNTNIKNRRSFDQDHVIVSAESSDYVKLHKKGMFSDTSSIINKSKNKNSIYDETKEKKEIRKKIKGLNKGK